jgi:hypothetical protein
MSFGTLQIEKMTTESGYTLGAGNASSFKNRIINGNMAIAQRGTTAFTQTTGTTYSLDRWAIYGSGGSQFTVQQLTSTPPAGYKNYLGVVNSATPVTPTATQEWDVFQYIEGYNIADLGWGAAGAQSVTVSFWVRSSVTGAFGASLLNYNSTRTFPFNYTINVANTWEQKTFTVAGDTTGTWNTNNTTGLGILFSMGAGATKSGPANAWAGANYTQPTGSVALISTASATWQVTGVQLEVGTVATSFDFRSIGTELALCQRYLPFIAGGGSLFTGQCFSSTNTLIAIPFKVIPRVAPTGVTVTNATSSSIYNAVGSGIAVATTTYVIAGLDSAFLTVTVASGLVSGNATGYIMGGPTNIAFTGCEL